MKTIITYINEKLKIRKNPYNYHPKTKEELKELLEQLIEERGNEGDFNDIDTSEITDMSYLFYEIEMLIIGKKIRTKCCNTFSSISLKAILCI